MQLLMLAAVLVEDPVVTPGPSIVLDANLAAILTALALLTTSISGLVVAIKANSRAQTARLESKADVAEVQRLVNGHSTQQAREIGSLTRALHEAGIPIPPAEAGADLGLRRRLSDTAEVPAVATEGTPITGTIEGVIGPAS